MSTPEPSSPDASSAATATPPADATPAVAPAPAPEPWTPERASLWNRYYDRYLVGGLVLLVFLTASHKVTNSTLWPLLKSGEVMVEKRSFLTTDPFSFTESGRRWVNIPWIYELVGHAVYSIGPKLAPREANLAIPRDPALVGQRDPNLGIQIGAGLLVGLNALARTLTVVLLLRLRRPGPGTWWFCTVALFAMGMVWGPRLNSFEFTPGGIARQPLILPETWGVLLLAAEILLLEKAYRRGSPRALLALPALFLLWANLDESFVYGLLILIAGVAGFAWKTKAGRAETEVARDRPKLGLSLGVLGGCVAICLVNPSLFHIFPTALEPYADAIKVVFAPAVGTYPSEQHAFFGQETYTALANINEGETFWNRLYYYFALLGVGAASFAINWRRFDAGRLAVLVVAALLWGGMLRLSAEFAAVFVFVVGLNGQEWYQERFGVEGRTSPGWSAWSVGGRAVTILMLFLAIAKTLTGYGYDSSSYPRVVPAFGYGVYTSEFDFEAAEFLKKTPIAGNVLNLHPNQGDALIWKGYPERKDFIDRRRGVFGADVRADLITFRKAFQRDETDNTVDRFKADAAVYRPILEKYKATAVMLDPIELQPAVYQGLLADTEHFVKIYDDGRTVIFGRKDAGTEDAKLFASLSLDAAEMVYRRPATVPTPDRAPTPMTFLDRIVRNRSLIPPQPHIFAASRWLFTAESASNNGLADAAHCIIAVREARIALHHNPDETRAYLLLAEAYRQLYANEVAAFRARSANPPGDLAQFRFRQRMTALNFAIQTTPPPSSVFEKQQLFQAHSQLAVLYRENNILDLEYDELTSAKELAAPEGLDPAEEKRRVTLDDAIGRFKDRLQQITTEQNADPQQRARQANAAGFVGLAIHEFEDAESQGVNADAVLASLIDLYCRTGQPEKASDKLSSKMADDPALSDGPGTAYTGANRQALVSSLMGFYDTATYYWKDRALIQIRQQESVRALDLGRDMRMGQARAAVSTLLEVMGVPGAPGLIETQSTWEWELGLTMLEAGQPKEAGNHFVNAIQIYPETPMRPLLEDYLKKLDIPLPLVAPGPMPAK